jgi:acetolactate synthase I/II/III large subunit
MAHLTGGQALVQSLLRHDVRTVFGLPGVQLDWIFDALYDVRDAITVVHTRHEQALSYMADGYARTTGRVGVCLMVPGPGLLNAMAGLATAYACSSPVLCLTGQIPSNLMGVGRGVLHEIKDQLTMAQSVSKWTGRAMRPEDIPGLVVEAFRQLRSGRPRPVVLEIPPDVLQAAGDVPLAVPAPVDVPAGDPEAIDKAARMLGKAEHPIIFAGGGVVQAEAGEPLRHLAETLQAPVVLTSNGKGALSDRHFLAQNMLAARELLPRADVVLVAGTRFVQPATGSWGPGEGQTVIQMDIDPEEIGRNRRVDVGIVADCRRGLAALATRVERYVRARPSRREELLAAKQRAADLFSSIQPQAAFTHAIREAVPEDGIVVSESTQVGYWMHLGFPVYRPRTFLTSGYQGTLGYGFPTALGAQAGNPTTPVVSINGDGGFMYNVQELSTVVRHKLNVATIVFNDDAFGNVLRIQRQNFGGHVIASDLRNPDFLTLAQAFGIEGVRTDSPDGLRAALRAVLASGHPALIEVPVGVMPDPWRLILK